MTIFAIVSAFLLLALLVPLAFSFGICVPKWYKHCRSTIGLMWIEPPKLSRSYGYIWRIPLAFVAGAFVLSTAWMIVLGSIIIMYVQWWYRLITLKCPYTPDYDKEVLRYWTQDHLTLDMALKSVRMYLKAPFTILMP